MTVLRVWLMPWRAARKIRDQHESILVLVNTLDRVLTESCTLVEIK